MKKQVSLSRKIIACLLMAATAWVLFSPTAQALRRLPATFRLAVGQTFEMNAGVAALSSTDETLLSLQGNQVQGKALGEAEITINLFGLLPIRRVRVQVEEDMRLMPGGQAVGIALNMQGVMVVGVSDVNGQSPAQLSGLKAGDVILSINGEPIETGEELTAFVERSGGETLQISFQRDGVTKSTLLTPKKDAASGLYRMGAWVRDSTAGVGTLSYYNPADGSYGALGHAILDADTGKLLSVRTGALMAAEIVSVKRGQKGAPGELRGSFLRKQQVLGDIRLNTSLGIYGEMLPTTQNPLYPEGVPVGYQESIETGPAQILSTVDQNGIRAYDVEIVKVNRQYSPSQKGMVVRVTDPELLEKTGGIVQGMSGSPILQNGRIIGAVTHVFVDDPAMGYGVFIEWMLETESMQEAEQGEKAA